MTENSPTKEQIKAALEASIDRWSRMAKTGIIEGLGPDHCALCELFFDNKYCKGCPVNHDGNHDYCGDTPYVAFENLPEVNLKNVDPEWVRKHAAAERDFLISLRPVVDE